MPIERRLSRGLGLGILLAVWAMIYLPNLGAIEFRGEEVHRVMPAVHMLQGHSWIVPRVAGKEYFAKPPGINWLIAASFTLTGQENEFTARLVSVVSILALVAAIMLGRGTWLSPGGRLIAGLSYLTFAAMMDKGRQIEIEAAYVSLTGLAVLSWLKFWTADRRWGAWLIGGFFVAAAAMLKGPLHGVVFYLMVVCVLAYQRRLKELIRLPHISAVALMAALCAAWAIPALLLKSQGDMTGRMTHEMMIRFLVPPRGYAHWLAEVARSALNFLPWLLFVPLWWIPRFTRTIREQHQPIFKGCRLAVVLGWVALNIMPGTEGRYSMPVWPLACLLVGWVLAGHVTPAPTDRLLKFGVGAAIGAAIAAGIFATVQYPSVQVVLALTAVVAVAATTAGLWRRIRTGTDLAVMLAGAVACWGLLYAVVVVPVRAEGAMYRPTAAAVNELSGDQPVTVYDTGYQTWLYYLDRPVVHLFAPDDITEEVTVLVIDQESLADPNVRAVIDPRRPESLYTFDRKLSERVFEVVRLAPPGATTTSAPAVD